MVVVVPCRGENPDQRGADDGRDDQRDHDGHGAPDTHEPRSGNAMCLAWTRRRALI
jgi:hypothetical protein